MEDNEQNKKKRFKTVRASFQYLNPFSLSRNTGTKEALDSAEYIKEQSAEILNHIKFLYSSKNISQCPECKNHSLKIVKGVVSVHPPQEQIITDHTNQIKNYNSEDNHLLLKCDICGYTKSMADIVSDDRTLEISKNLYKNAKSIFWTSFIILILGTVYSLFAQSLISLLGFLIVASVSFLKCAQFRYRGWQYAYKRLFENEAPIQDWIKWEKNRLKSD